MTKDVLDLAQSAKRFFSGTMISRISGLGRDMSMAYAFGSQPLVAAFMIAFRFSNVLRRLFGEGALQSAFVPHFEDVREEAPLRAAGFYRDLSIGMTFFLLIIILLTELGLWVWLKFGAPAPDNAVIIELTAIMFPGILFICLYGLNSALLQCQGSFFTPSVAPVAFNCIWILAVFLLKGMAAQEAIPLLAMAVVVAYLFQWAMTVPLSYLFIITHLPKRFWKGIQLRSDDLRRLIKPLFLGIVGVSASQINNALDPLFARAADLEGPAYLWYALRLQQLPLALFGIAFSTALLPSLSRTVKTNEMKRYIQLLGSGVRRTLCLMIPCTLALLAMGCGSINLLFGRGGFGNESITQTTFCLWAYGVGAVPQILVILFASALYAQKNYLATTRIALASLLINVALNALFVFGLNLSSASVALATSLAALFNFLALAVVFWLTLVRTDQGLKPLLNSELKAVFLCVMKITFCSLIAAAVSMLIGSTILQDPALLLFLTSSPQVFSKAFTHQLLIVAVEAASFGVVVFFGGWCLQIRDLTTLFRFKAEPPRQINL